MFSYENLQRTYRSLDVLIKSVEELEGFAMTSLSKEKDTACFIMMNTYFYFSVKEEINKHKSKSKSNETPPDLILSIEAKNLIKRRYTH
jgi:hypothetical protein